MSGNQAFDDRYHAVEFQKMLESWRELREASSTSVRTLARHEPADAQTEQARVIIAALKTHGRPTARFVANQLGSSQSATVLSWVDSQLAIRWPTGIKSPGRVFEGFVNLSDVAPTFLAAAGLKPPAMMTAHSLMHVFASAM